MQFHKIEIRPVPANLRQKNIPYPSHGPIRSIFIRLRNADPTCDPHVLAIRAVRIYNTLYGSDVMSAFEAAKGYNHPLSAGSSPVPVDAELSETHDNLLTHRKLTRILRSYSFTPH